MTADEDDRTLSTDTIYDLLADRRRRYLLYCLYRYTNPVALPRVADCVTEWELSTPADEVPDERLRVYMSLYHDHLPKLGEAGVIEYSQTDDTVALAPPADRLKPHLERTAESDLAPSDREW